MALLSRSLAIENEGQQDHDLDADFALVSRSMAIEDDDLDAEHVFVDIDNGVDEC